MIDIGALTGSISLEDHMSSGLDLVSNKVEKFATEFEGALGGIAVGAGIAVAAIGAVVGVVTALGNRGADVNDVAATLEQFTGSAENAEAVLQKMRAGVLGTVDDFVLMKNSARLLSAGVKLNADDFGLLSQASFVLQNQGLGTTTEMMDLLSDAMVTGRTKGLAAKAGVVDLGDAHINYANKLGLTVDKLTDTQKAEATRIEILRIATAKVHEAGIQHRDFGEQIEFAITKVKNFVDDLARQVAASPAVMRAIDGIGGSLKEAFGGSREAAIKGIVGQINNFADIVTAITPSIVTFKNIIVTVAGFISDYAGALKVATIAFVAYQAIQASTTLKTIAFFVANKDLPMALSSVSTAVKIMAGNLTLSGGSLAVFVSVTGPVIAAVAAITAAVVIGYQAWAFYREYQDRAASAQRQATVDTANLERISKVAGLTFKDMSEAEQWVRDNHDKLVVAGKPAIESVKGAGEAAADAATKATALALAAQKQQDALKAAAEEAKKTAEAWKNYSSVAGGIVNQLSGDTIDGIKWDLARGQSQSDLALVYKVTAAQISAVADLLKDETEAAKGALDIEKLFASEGNRHWKDWRDAVEKQLNSANTLMVTNFTDRMAAQRTFDDDVAKATLDSFDFQKRQVKQHLDDQKAALVTKGGDWEAAFKLDTKVANTQLNLIEWDKIQQAIDDTDAKIPTLGFTTKATFKTMADDAKTAYTTMLAEGKTIWTADEIEDARLKWVAANNKALGNSNHAFSEAFSSMLSNGATAFTQLAQIGGTSFGETAKKIGSVVTALDAVVKGVNAYEKAVETSGRSAQASFALAATVVGAMALALDMVVTSFKNADDELSKFNEHAGQLREITAFFGTSTTLSEGLKQSLQGLSITVKATFPDMATWIAYDVAIALRLVDVIKDMGGVASLTKEQLVGVGTVTEKLFEVIKMGGPLSVQAVKALDDTMVMFGQSATASGGLVTKFFLDTIDHARAAGVELSGVNDFLLGQMKSGAEGVNTLLTGLQQSATASAQAQARALGTMTDQQIAAIKDGVVLTQAQGDGLAASVVANFAHMVDGGMSFRAALDLLKPSVDVLTESIHTSWWVSSENFKFLTEMSRITHDAILGPLTDAIGGANQALKGLHNSGILTQEMFTGLELTAVDAYKKIISGGGNAAAANMMIQPTLQTLWSLQKDFGYAVDDVTKGLIDEAVAAGTVGDKHRPIAEQMLLATQGIQRAVESLATVFGVGLPAAAAVGAKGVNDSLAKITAPSIKAPWADWQAPPTFDGGSVDVQGLAGGGRVIQGPWGVSGMGTDTTMIAATPGEGLVTVRGMSKLGDEGLNAINAGLDFGGSHSNVHDDEVHQAINALRDDIRTSLPNIVAAAVKSVAA